MKKKVQRVSAESLATVAGRIRHGEYEIDPKYAERAGWRSATREAAMEMKFPFARRSQGGLVIPYFNPLTHAKHPNLNRIRYQGVLPIDPDNGKEVRYIQPADSEVEAYFDPNIDWLHVFQDESINIGITEGEAKALAVNQHWRYYNMVFVAIGGVWNFREKETGDLTPWLRMVRAASQSHRGVLVLFDSDMEHKQDMQRASETLVKLMGLKYTSQGVVAWE